MNKYFLFIGFLLLFLSFILGANYYPWPSFYNELIAFLSLVALLLNCSKHKMVSISLSSVFLIFLSITPALQYFFGVIYFFGDAFLSSVYILTAAISIVVGATLRENNINSIYFLSIFLLVSASVSTYFALYQWLDLTYFGIWIIPLSGERPYANLAQPNNFSTLVLLGLISLYYLYQKKKLSFIPVAFFTFFLLIGIVLADSRTSILSSLIVLTWLILKMNVSKVNWYFIFYTAFTWLLLVCLLPEIKEALLLSGESRNFNLIPSSRIKIWTDLISVAFDNGLFGYGWNQVSIARMNVVPAYDVTTVYVEHSHNLFIDLLIWGGAVGAVTITLIVIWGVSACLRAYSLESIYLMSCIGAFLCHALLEFPIEYAFFLIPIFIIVGMVEADQRASKYIEVKGCILLFIAFLGFLLLSFIFKEYRGIEDEFREVRMNSARIESSYTKKSDVIFLTQLRALIDFADSSARPDMTVNEIDLMKKVAYRYSYPPSLFRYSLALAFNGDVKSASKYLDILKYLYGWEMHDEAINNLRIIENDFNGIKELIKYHEKKHNLRHPHLYIG